MTNQVTHQLSLLSVPTLQSKHIFLSASDMGGNEFMYVSQHLHCGPDQRHAWTVHHWLHKHVLTPKTHSVQRTFPTWQVTETSALPKKKPPQTQSHLNDGRPLDTTLKHCESLLRKTLTDISSDPWYPELNTHTTASARHMIWQCFDKTQVQCWVPSKHNVQQQRSFQCDDLNSPAEMALDP